jgi:protein-S-isoprenylcysteine O-methyltransferase Ste14
MGMEPATAGTPQPRPTTLQIGPLKLRGIAAIIALFVMLGGIIALFWWRGLPRWPVGASALLWIAFISYWSAAAKTAAPTQSSESAASRRTHVRLMNTAFVFLFFLPVSILGLRFLPDSPWLAVAGLAIQVAAGMLGVSARRHLGRNWSGAITVADNHQLVTTGPYRVLRHPIYVAMIGMFAGSAIAIGTWHALVGVALIVIAYARKIPLEEQSLRAVFGPAYEEYRKSRWF